MHYFYIFSFNNAHSITQFALLSLIFNVISVTFLILSCLNFTQSATKLDGKQAAHGTTVSLLPLAFTINLQLIVF